MTYFRGRVPMEDNRRRSKQWGCEDKLLSLLLRIMKFEETLKCRFEKGGEVLGRKCKKSLV
ncbi:MAG: hypothetical protein STSR0009_28320 [Methanoregula sp.]